MGKLAEVLQLEELASLLAPRTTYSLVGLDTVEAGRREQHRRTSRSVSEGNPLPQALSLQMELVCYGQQMTFLPAGRLDLTFEHPKSAA